MKVEKGKCFIIKGNTVDWIYKLVEIINDRAGEGVRLKLVARRDNISNLTGKYNRNLQDGWEIIEDGAEYIQKPYSVSGKKEIKVEDVGLKVWLQL